MAIESINPANGKLLRRFDPLTDEAIAPEDRPRLRGLPRLSNRPARTSRPLHAQARRHPRARDRRPRHHHHPRDGQASPHRAPGGAQVRHRLPLLRRERRPHPRARIHPDRRQRQLRPLGPARRRPRRDAVELPLLAGLPLPRACADGRQRRPAQARLQRARSALSRSRRSSAAPAFRAAPFRLC